VSSCSRKISRTLLERAVFGPVREPARCLANRAWRPSISLFDPSLGAFLAPLCSLIERVERRVFVFVSSELVTFLVGAFEGVQHRFRLFGRWARSPRVHIVASPSVGRGRLHRCCPGRVPAGRRCCCHAWPCLATAELHRPVSWRVASATCAVPCARFRPSDGRPSFACRVVTRAYPAARRVKGVDLRSQ
jgi:hypothetical protein